MDQEIDIELFITCRLCLEEPGSYQIVPRIQSQIKFSFGIDIQPFDGLPQLICKKCKAILAGCYSIKTGLLEKQKQLHNKLPKENNNDTLVPQVSECLPKESPPDVTPPGEPAQPPATPASGVAAAAARHDSEKKTKHSWKKRFNKYFVCTICSKSFSTERSIKKHSTTHQRFISKHEKVFKTYLTVRLNKVDKKMNSTGGLRNVVYNKNKIIEQCKSQYHLSFYLKEDNNKTDENKNVATKRLQMPSSPSDDEIIEGKQRKTGRRESTSSIQTLILENNKDTAADTDNQTNYNETEITKYINLDDSSSDCLEHNTGLESADYKEIQNIVSVCHKNYIKKIQADTDLNSTDKFETQGFACTGLSRYMEHKNIDVTWTPTTNDMQKKGSSSVHIMTKLKSREDSKNDDACWENLHDISFFRDIGAEAVVAATHDVRSNDQSSLQPVKTEEDPRFHNDLCEANDLNYTNRLLNKSPIANPRQLPKKNNISEVKLVGAADDAAEIPPTLHSDGSEDAQVDDNMCLPIITSTTSLSLNVSEKVKEVLTEIPAPRIKLKPVSELMPARALNNQEIAGDIWAFNPIQSSFAHHLTHTAISGDSPMTDSYSGLQTVDNKDEESQSIEYILLDSPQFPNTKTLAPFEYFRKVLLVHGLRLMDLNEELPDHFSCLIKFKLIVKQETKTPIAVLLSLYCSKDTFCFAFKDAHYKQFDPNYLPAFWQWEFLKVYKSHLVDKILQNALKVGKEAHDYTRLFLCLLKSINMVEEA